MGEEGGDGLVTESEIGFSARSAVVAMETPERSQIASALSKFEDSPVFNYINNLSPIQPVKSAHISQSFSSLSFASLPSVFTSPHVSSLKESRILRRHHFSDPSKPEFSSEGENRCGVSEGIVNATHNCSEQQESFEPSSSVVETSMEPSYDCSKVEIEFSRTLTYDCVSPDATNKAEMASTTSMVSFVPGDSEKVQFGNEANVEGVNPVDQDKATPGCDWGSMLIDASDMLLFESPIVSEPRKESCEKESDFLRSHTNDLAKTQAFDALASSKQHGTEKSSQEGGNLKETSIDQELLVDTSFNNFVAGEPSENINDELGSNLNRGMRRRCLVFEMGGSHRKHLTDGSNSGSSTSQTHEITSFSDKSLVPVKPDSSRCIVPGIGLHLNSLAATSVDHHKVAKHETLPSGGQLTIAPPSSASFHALATGQESVNSLSGATSERGIGPKQNEASIVDDTSQTLGYMVNDELNHSSPKKKRRKAEHAGESEACKRCNCKKSKCLKLYCECFAAGVYCVEPCSCQDCFNKPIHEDTVLATRKQIESRNPLAFAPKVIRSSDSVIEIGDESNKTPASARHKRGCNCKKSGCLKKYCECYQGGVGCSINCRCEGCKNAFGRKDGSEGELEEDEMDECETSVIDRSMQKAIVPFDAEQNSATPGTPSRFGRQSIQLPMSSSSKGKPPRSFLPIGSSGIHTIQRFGKPNTFQSQGQFGKHFQTVNEQDEMPEILQGNGSPPISGIKTASPNRKRVSPPHCSSIRLSPGQRSSRKLILQSIPSFPSLTPKH